DGEALCAAARPADDRGIRLSGLRGAGVEWRDGAGRYAAADHRATQCGDECDSQGTRGAAEDARVRLRPDRRHTRRFWRADQRRGAKVGTGDQEGRTEGRLIEWITHACPLTARRPGPKRGVPRQPSRNPEKSCSPTRAVST